MSSRRKCARPAFPWMGFVGAALAVAPAVAHAAPADLFYERTAMAAVGERCRLFAPEVAQALSAATVQARGAALRSGVSPEDLREGAGVARAKAARLGCASTSVTAAAERVKTAFSGYARISHMSYPGDVAAWEADRIPGRSSRWRLRQETTFGADRMSFGLVQRDSGDVLVVVARFADRASPYGARLVMRDASRSSGPYLDRRASGPTAGLPLARRMPQSAAQASFLAEARDQADRDLLPRDERTGWAFRFPASAGRALAGLDPREAVAVDFLFAGDRVRRAYVEVGDFAAGLAFLQAAH